MATCGVCSCNVPSIRSLFVHFKLAHSELSGSDLYICGEPNCGRVFNVKNSLQYHLLNHHHLLLHHDQENVVEYNIENRPQQAHARVPDEPIINESNNISVHEFETALDADAFELISKLYSKRRFPINTAESVIEDFQRFFGGGHLSILKAKVEKALSQPRCSAAELNDILTMFQQLEHPFDDLSSDYKRIQRLENEGHYIAPIPYIIDRSFMPKNKQGSGLHGKMVDLTGQYVPLRSVLKKFFQLPDALSSTLAYMDSLTSNPSTVIRNYIQSTHWSDKRSRFKIDDIVIPINCSCDDINMNNPLGGHIGKVAAMYASIPCLPPECVSLLENHFLVLVYESYLRADKLQETYKPVIDELIHLETEGIEIETEDGLKKVYFVLGLLQGDNLGLHGMLGLVESFAANHYCRFCKMEKSVCISATQISPELKRSVEQYEIDVLSPNRVADSGIKERCPFNVIPSFHAMTNYSVDEMHDYNEGIAHTNMVLIVDNLTDGPHKEFDLSVLNERIRMFDYGPIDGRNKPNLIRENDLRKSKHLKMTASEMTRLVLRFGVIIGDLVKNRNNLYWTLYLMLREMFDFTLAKKVTRDDCTAFGNLVAIHHRFRFEEFGITNKPKDHTALHYEEVSKQIGPVIHASSMRSEAKHTHLTAFASGSRSRVNIALTLAKRHQLNMAYRFLKNESILPRMKLSKKFESIRAESINCQLPTPLVDHEIFKSPRWIEYKGTVFQPGMVLITEPVNLIPAFVEIKQIIICDGITEPFFICKCLSNLGFNQHVWAYEVLRMEKIICIKVTDLLDPLPVTIHTMANGELYIGLRYGI